MSDQAIEIADLISKVKQDLLVNRDDGPVLFLIGQVELTISFTAERDLNGGIKLKVIELGGGLKSNEVQTVKVTLEPLVTPEQVRQDATNIAKNEAAKHLTRGMRLPD